jgi:hypothetical protein
MAAVTYNAAQPARSDRAGTASDVKVFISAVLLTFGAGLLLMVGYALLSSGFGGFLGIIAAVFGIVWWRSIHGKVFPAEIPTRSVIILAAVNVILAVILFLVVG